MTRRDLIEAIIDHMVEQKKSKTSLTRVAGAVGSGGLIGAPVGGVLGFIAGSPTPRLNVGKLGAVAGVIAGSVYAHKKLSGMEQRAKKIGVKKAGKEFRRKHKVLAAMVLPKYKKDKKKLSRRSMGGHIGHSIVRAPAAGPFNIARYGSKVSYAKKGYHRY
jgi:uncharacterized protein YcfJ